ncbi:MAG: hypothetical protein AAB368_01120, partial [bacterium]
MSGLVARTEALEAEIQSLLADYREHTAKRGIIAVRIGERLARAHENSEWEPKYPTEDAFIFAMFGRSGPWGRALRELAEQARTWKPVMDAMEAGLDWTKARHLVTLAEKLGEPVEKVVERVRHMTNRCVEELLDS